MTVAINMLKILVIVIITENCVMNAQENNRYSLPDIKGGGLAKGNFFYGYLICKQQDKQLPTPDTEEKMNELLNFIEEYSIVKTWISGTDLAEEGQFRWFSTGKAMNYTYWHNNQPDNFNNAEHCVEVVPIYHHIRWNDVACDAKTNTIICEDLDEVNFNIRFGN